MRYETLSRSSQGREGRGIGEDWVVVVGTGGGGGGGGLCGWCFMAGLGELALD